MAPGQVSPTGTEPVTALHPPDLPEGTPETTAAPLHERDSFEGASLVATNPLQSLWEAPGRAADAVGRQLRAQLDHVPDIGVGDSTTLNVSGYVQPTATVGPLKVGDRTTVRGELTLTRGVDSSVTLSTSGSVLEGTSIERSILKDSRLAPKGEGVGLAGLGAQVTFKFKNQDEARRVVGDYLQYVVPKLPIGGAAWIASDPKARAAVAELAKHIDSVQGAGIGSIDLKGTIGGSSQQDKDQKSIVRLFANASGSLNVTGTAQAGVYFKNGAPAGVTTSLGAQGGYKYEGGAFFENNATKTKISLNPFAGEGTLTLRQEVRSSVGPHGLQQKFRTSFDYNIRPAGVAGNSGIPNNRNTVTIETDHQLDARAASAFAHGDIEGGLRLLPKDAAVSIVTGNQDTRGFSAAPSATLPGGAVKVQGSVAINYADRYNRSGSAHGGPQPTPPWQQRLGQWGLSKKGTPAEVLHSIQHVEQLAIREHQRRPV